jgi:hypothetical protein
LRRSGIETFDKADDAYGLAGVACTYRFYFKPRKTS